jgi:hypothetical protein
MSVQVPCIPVTLSRDLRIFCILSFNIDIGVVLSCGMWLFFAPHNSGERFLTATSVGMREVSTRALIRCARDV